MYQFYFKEMYDTQDILRSLEAESKQGGSLDVESKQGGRLEVESRQGESQPIDIKSHSANIENKDKNCTSIQIERVESQQI
jgi:hypothetical protein